MRVSVSVAASIRACSLRIAKSTTQTHLQLYPHVRVSLLVVAGLRQPHQTLVAIPILEQAPVAPQQVQHGRQELRESDVEPREEVEALV